MPSLSDRNVASHSARSRSGAERRQRPARAGVRRVAEAATGPVDAGGQGGHGMIGLGKGQAQVADRHPITRHRSSCQSKTSAAVPILVNSRRPGRREDGDSCRPRAQRQATPRSRSRSRPVVRVLMGDDNGIHLLHGRVPLQVGQRAAAASSHTAAPFAGQQVAAASATRTWEGAVAAEDRQRQRHAVRSQASTWPISGPSSRRPSRRKVSTSPEEIQV